MILLWLEKRKGPISSYCLIFISSLFKQTRSKKSGSLFISLLCEIVRKKPEQELKSILTDVNREIVKKEKTLEFVIRLTKNFHLTKRGGGGGGGKVISKSLTNLQTPMRESNEPVKHYNQLEITVKITLLSWKRGVTLVRRDV